MTQLVLIRHGMAEDPDTAPHGLDRERRLTDAGEGQLRRVALGLGRLLGDGVFEGVRIGHSPLVRTTQTAAILAEVLGGTRGDGGPIPQESVDALAPGADFEAVLAWVRERGGPTLIAVGHEPDLGGLATWFASGRPSRGMPFPRAGVCVIDQASAGPGIAAVRAFLPTDVTLALADAP